MNRKVKLLCLSAALFTVAVLAALICFRQRDVPPGLPQQECRLCGSGIQSLGVQYTGKTDSIGLFNVNTGNVVDFQIREFEPDGTERTDRGGYMLLFGSGSENGASSALISTSPDRHFSTAQITPGTCYFPNRKKMCQYLCDGCMQQVENLNAPCDFVLYDFYTGELHGVGSDTVGFAARDYWVEIVEGKKGFQIITIYAPTNNTIS